MNEITGKKALEYLAGIYPQLYLTPGEGAPEIYKKIVTRGEDAPTHDLGHFIRSDRDVCGYEETPAGEVLAVTLYERKDFECFLQIMAYRCAAKEIPRTQGAVLLSGVINWEKIRAHEREFLSSGGDEAGWNEEFRRFTAVPDNYKDVLIALSAGPYSAVPAKDVGMEEEEWLRASYRIRKAHECTHFICRRLCPEKIDAVWDELIADAVGIFAAFGHYDRAMAERFLGISTEGYVGGRLENYVEKGPDLNERLEALTQKVRKTLYHLETVIGNSAEKDPYRLALQLEDEYDFWKSL